jgi:SAM-dependent methyltransferase
MARPAVRAYELALATRSQLAARRTTAADDLPLPPATLRTQVGPMHADAGFFLASGAGHADLIRTVLRDEGTAIEELGAILDWGCGCGRVLRHWSRNPRGQVHGCDVNTRMVEWCDAHLSFATVAATGMSPPLPYEDRTFGLVYAFSVFTHLPEDLQHAWMAECLRVLEPGGFLLLSTLGEDYASRDRLTDRERRSFAAGSLVVLYEDAPGTSLCSAYHPSEYVRRELGRDFELVSFRPAADDGRHDIHLFRKPAA